ncbi:MAG: c-type cytochrome [Acidobacteriota bacterium]
MPPRFLVYGAIALTLVALVPLALIARARVTTSPVPRLNVVPDMDNQIKFKPQSEDTMFADGRAMREPVPDTVARGELDLDSAYYRGKTADGGWVTAFPVPVTERLVRRGEDRFDIYCSPCHGLAGYGDGIVAKRADSLQEGTWTPPSSFHTDLVRGRPVGHLFNTITNGIRNMPAYGPQIPVVDRWAIVSYIRALQLSQDARPEDVPPDLRAQLR